MPAFYATPVSALTTTWRIFHEASADLNPREESTDFEELRGTSNDCRIYRHGRTELAVSTEQSGMWLVLSRIPGVTKKTGCVLLFPDSLLDIVAKVIRARYVRQYTPEQLAQAKARGRKLAALRLRDNSGQAQAPKTDDRLLVCS